MKTRTILALALPALLSTSLQAADAAAGKALTDENCYSCHGNEVYTRADRKVTTFSGLMTQVTRCEQALGLHWFPEQVEDVSTYLNHNFYKIK